MNRKILFKKINELCLYLDTEYNINNGGCCFVAACIAEQLEICKIPFTIIHYDLWHCHYAVRVSDRYLNRCEFRKKEITETLNCTSKELFDIYNEGDWNESYQTRYNKTIKRLIRELFNENSRT